MKPDSLIRPRWQRWLMRLGLMLMGVALAFVLFEGMLRLFPSLTDRRARSQSMAVRFTVGMGDLFLHRPQAVRPPPNPDEVLSDHVLTWDADGFRVPARPADRYDVLALGDSYTEGTNVTRPWPDALAAESGLAVYNMGFRGYGPAEEARVLRDYGPKYAPRLVIMAYFEGNDLSDAASYRWRGEFVLPNLAREQFGPFGGDFVMPTPHPEPYQFPVSIDLNGTHHEIAFLDSYLGWLNGEPDTFSNSDNMGELDRHWRDAQAALPDDCLIVAYLPTGPHIYAPYVVPEDRARMLATVQEVFTAAPGALIEERVVPMPFEAVMARLNNQRDAVAALAKRHNLPFVDLIPAFQEAAARGEVLYYTYDTHWTQAGHDLAGRTIAAYLKQNPTPCAAQ